MFVRFFLRGYLQRGIHQTLTAWAYQQEKMAERMVRQKRWTSNFCAAVSVFTHYNSKQVPYLPWCVWCEASIFVWWTCMLCELSWISSQTYACRNDVDVNVNLQKKSEPFNAALGHIKVNHDFQMAMYGRKVTLLLTFFMQARWNGGLLLQVVKSRASSASPRRSLLGQETHRYRTVTLDKVRLCFTNRLY